MFGQPLHEHTTGVNVFQEVHDFFTKEGQPRTDCIGVCTDGAAAMTGHTAGFPPKSVISSVTPITFTHCVIHQESLEQEKFFRS